MIFWNLLEKQILDCTLGRLNIKYVMFGQIMYRAWFYKGSQCGCFYPYKNDILDDNLPYRQFGCWRCQSNMSKLNSGSNFLCATQVQ